MKTKTLSRFLIVILLVYSARSQGQDDRVNLVEQSFTDLKLHLKSLILAQTLQQKMIEKNTEAVNKFKLEADIGLTMIQNRTLDQDLKINELEKEDAKTQADLETVKDVIQGQTEAIEEHDQMMQQTENKLQTVQMEIQKQAVATQEQDLKLQGVINELEKGDAKTQADIETVKDVIQKQAVAMEEQGLKLQQVINENEALKKWLFWPNFDHVFRVASKIYL